MFTVLGVSCGFNLAHQMQRFLPFAQMPHHHDWHHEGPPWTAKERMSEEGGQDVVVLCCF